MRFKKFVVLAVLLPWLGVNGYGQERPPELGERMPVLLQSFLAPQETPLPLRDGLPMAPEPATGPIQIGWSPGGKPPIDYKRLMRPRFSFGFDWEPVSGGLGLHAYDLSITVPTYPIFGPPPPMITTGYSYTQLTSDPSLGLPKDLHEASVGLGWVRRINRKWITRWMINTTYASDLQNTRSEAWQLRGGGFGIYRPNERWSFAIGALATGRSDIPVLPAAGFIYEPSNRLKLNLMMPEPRISWWLAERDGRQLWAYLGGGIAGGNWAFRRPDLSLDRLNYREWRLVAGWESKPVQAVGMFRPVGRVFQFEVGYALGREINFQSGAPDIDLGDAFLLRTGLRF